MAYKQVLSFIPNQAGKVEIRAVPSAPNYFADRLGNIYSNFKSRGGRHGDTGLKKIKATLDKDGYQVVSVHLEGGSRKQFRAHRMVALAWIPNTHNKPTVNHLNEIKTDNRIENLEWATVREQNLHSKQKFYRSLAKKLVAEDVKDIRMFCEAGIDTKRIAQTYKISRTNVYSIWRRRSWGWLV